MQKAFDGKAKAALQERIQSRNRRTNIIPRNFDAGDFVLCGRLKRSRASKPAMKLFGTQRVVGVLSQFLLAIEDLRSGERSTVRGTRLKSFRNSFFEVTGDCLEQMELSRWGTLYRCSNHGYSSARGKAAIVDTLERSR